MDFLKIIIKHKREEINNLQIPASLKLKRRGFFQAIVPDKEDNNDCLTPALIAEIKRSSPSNPRIYKGRFNPGKIAQTFEKSGACAISVLTDQKFFNGSFDYLTAAKKATKKAPILAKDFFISEKQILAAKNAGADAVLLIAKTLTLEKLKKLIRFTYEQNLEAVLEIADQFDLKKALKCRAPIIGINNRDLRNFKINISATFKLAKRIASNQAVISMSGFSGRDVQLVKEAAHAVLVGTKIMQAENIQQRIKEFTRPTPLIKICGIRDPQAAEFAEKLGVDLVGLNFAPNSKRRITLKKAGQIREKLNQTKVVGVFQNQDVNFVNRVAKKLKLDFVQLHGDEPPTYCYRIKHPLIRAISIKKLRDLKKIDKFDRCSDIFLFDGPAPGSGQGFTLELVRNIKVKKPFLVAGGVNAENAEFITNFMRPIGVDTASGVEENGKTSLKKIAELVKVVHSVRLDPVRDQRHPKLKAVLLD